jgi:hypothetical protein
MFFATMTQAVLSRKYPALPDQIRNSPVLLCFVRASTAFA